MTINSINNVKSSLETNTQSQKINTTSQNINKTTNANQQSNGLSPLSSRYTYAIGRDGKRYVLQLRIDISSIRALSSLA